MAPDLQRFDRTYFDYEETSDVIDLPKNERTPLNAWMATSYIASSSSDGIRFARFRSHRPADQVQGRDVHSRDGSEVVSSGSSVSKGNQHLPVKKRTQFLPGNFDGCLLVACYILPLLY